MRLKVMLILPLHGEAFPLSMAEDEHTHTDRR
jgi:hypothetical protein